MKTALKYIFIASLCLCGRLFAHDVPVHEAITVNAAEAAFNNSSSFSGFLNIVSPDRPLSGPLSGTNSMRIGSAREDDPRGLFPTDIGGYRSLNHFYDPLDTVYGKGLSDSPPDGRVLEGINSFAWASISNSTGIGSSHYPNFFTDSHPTNTWSWQNARYFEWLGLTETNQSDRQSNLDNMFRAVGQVMHLLEDTSQPQHVRNEQHVDKLGTWPFWESPIEDFGLANVTNINYGDGSMLDWRGAGFTKLEDFWDRHMYNGNSVALVADANENPNGGPNSLGLAEWCNGNFLGDRHSYSEYFLPKNPDGTPDIMWYPYPSLFTSTSYLQHGAFADYTIYENGDIVKRYYLPKTGDGIQIRHFSTVSWFGAKFPNQIIKVATSIRDDNVLYDYHNAFIPKAVNYSAGLIDYFFRGTMDVSVIGYDTNSMQYTNLIVNTSGDDFKNGTFYIFQDDSTNNRTLVAQTNLSDAFGSATMHNNDSVAMTFLALTNSGSTNKFLLVYQGTISTPGSADDPVDTNIAVAAKDFHLGTIEQVLAYDDNWGDLGGYGLSDGGSFTTNLVSAEFPFTITDGNYEVIINTAAFDDKGVIGGVASDTFSDAVGHCTWPNAIANKIVPVGNITIMPDGKHLSVNITATDEAYNPVNGCGGGSIGYKNVNITWRAWPAQ